MASARFWTSANTGANPVKSDFSMKNVNIGDKGKRLAKKLGVSGMIVGAILGVITLFLFIFVIGPGLALMKSVDVIKEDSKVLQQNFTDRDLVEFQKTLAKTQKDLENLRNTRNAKFGWAKNFPLTKEYFADSERFINAGMHGVKAGEELVTVVTPFADAVGLRVTEEEIDTNPDQGLAEAFAAWIAVMPQVADDMDGVINELDAVGDELSYVDASRYPKSFRGIALRENIVELQETLSKVGEYGPDLKSALKIIPGLLGVSPEPEKRYMIIMQNDKEVRGTGGFWTYLATFKVNEGLLSSDFTSYNSYYVDEVLNAIDSYYTFPAVPDSYRQHLRVERMFARDANVSPDLPTSVDQFMVFWKLATPIVPNEFKPVDGVITIDTKVLEELLEITGPVTVNGTTYSSENVVLELEKLASLALKEQVNRKKILGDMMEEMLLNVFESDKNLWPKLVEKGVDLAVRKHIQATLINQPDAQTLIEKYNFGGRIVDPVEGDYAYVVSTNLGGDKTNWFTTKEVTHELSKEGSRYVKTVKIKYTYKEPGPEFGPFIKRFRDWVRVYAPAGSELIAVNGSEAGTGEGEERNKKYFHGYIELGPNETKEITFKYYIPDNVVSNGKYKFYIQKQSGIDSEVHNVVVNGKTEKLELTTDKKYTTNL